METSISIIIPCYNSEEYLSECIQSILNQTFDKWEAICVNDGSTDNTLTILQQFSNKDPRIKVISQQNNGVASARNKALSQCTNNYICFIDSDDTIEANFLETLFKYIHLDNDIDLSICNFTKNMSSDFSPQKEQIWEFKGHECAAKIVKDKHFHPQIWCMLFKKQIIEDNQLTFTEGCTRGEDIEFIMKYLVHCRKINYSSKILYHYRIHENSAMASFNKKSLTSLEASQRVCAYYDQYQNPAKETIQRYAVSRTLWKFLILSLLQHNKEIYKQLIETYNIKTEMQKLYDYPSITEKLTARLMVISPSLFYWFFYLLGFIYKH